MSSILVKTDINGKIIDVNDKFCEISKYPKDELIGKTPHVVSSGYHANGFFRKMWHTIQSGKVWREEVKNKAKDGSLYWIDTTIVPYLTNEQNPYQYLAISNDITDKKNYEVEIKHMAYFDLLTDLPNRRNFVEKLEQDLSIASVNQRLLTVMFLDLDRFKNVNDTLSRLVGDQLIVQVGIRLKANLGKECFIARLGGVEFGVLFPKISNIEASIEYANQIIKAFEEPFIIDDYECKITTSIGIATFPEAGEDSITILKHANLAMCRAKNRGRNNYQFYSPAMNISTYKKFTLYNDLQKALLLDQFFLEYQPRINPNTNKIVSAEALIRWDHPEWGIISPNEFIQMAEETGFINKIGDWVLHTVCKQLKKWQEQKTNYVRISINLSANQLLQYDFVKKIIEITGHYNIASDWIEFEITESMLISNEDGVRKVFEQLNEKGFKFAIDDFGTGYSSLSYLKKYKLDTLKLDRSLIKNISNDGDGKEIAFAIITLGKKLGMNVVAEGVERVEELQALMKTNCDEIQGYLFSKPVGISKFEELLKLGKCFPVVNGENLEVLIEDKRQFFRIDFKYPLKSEMTVLKIGEKPVLVGSTDVLIEEITSGGIRFLSKIKLSERNGVLIGFETELLGKIVQVSGYIIWVRELNLQIKQYGLKLEISEKSREELAVLLDQLQLKLLQNPLLKNCNFITISKEEYFKKIDE